MTKRERRERKAAAKAHPGMLHALGLCICCAKGLTEAEKATTDRLCSDCALDPKSYLK